MRAYVTNTTTAYADDDDESDYTESAYGETSDGDSTIRLSCHGRKKSNNKDKTKDDKVGGDKKTKKKNDCPHCKGMATVAHIPKPHTRNASGIKSGRDSVRAHIAMSWRRHSSRAPSSWPSWAV